MEYGEAEVKWLQDEICKIIRKITSIGLLRYLHTFIKGKTKTEG